MEVRVRERLVGALVLVAIVVLLVPAVLKGPERAPEGPAGPENQSVVVELDEADPPAQDEVLVPEPPAPQPATPTAESLPPPAATQPATDGDSAAATRQAPAVTSRTAEAPPTGGAASRNAGLGDSTGRILDSRKGRQPGGEPAQARLRGIRARVPRVRQGAASRAGRDRNRIASARWPSPSGCARTDSSQSSRRIPDRLECRTL